MSITDLQQLTRLDAAIFSALNASESRAPILADIVQDTRMSGQVQLVVETVIVDEGDPFDWLGPRYVDDVHRFSDGSAYRLFADERGPFIVGALATRFDGVFHILGTIPVTDPRWKRVLRWIAQGAPHLAPCFLNHDDFVAIGTALSEFGDVEVSRLSAKRRSDQSSLTRGWKEREGSIRPSPVEAIEEAEKETASVRTLTLSVERRIKIHLRRTAGATLYWGNFKLFESFVLQRLAESASKRRSLLYGRQRRIAQAPPKPISIVLDRDVLVDREATGQLLKVLEGESGLAVGVFHRNPYFHAVVTDYADGSNFDVLVTVPNEVEVHPGFRSSLGSLARLTQLIGDRFAGTEIREAPDQEEVSLEDLVGSG